MTFGAKSLVFICFYQTRHQLQKEFGIDSGKVFRHWSGTHFGSFNMIEIGVKCLLPKIPCVCYWNCCSVFQYPIRPEVRFIARGKWIFPTHFHARLGTRNVQPSIVQSRTQWQCENKLSADKTQERTFVFMKITACSRWKAEKRDSWLSCMNLLLWRHSFNLDAGNPDSNQSFNPGTNNLEFLHVFPTDVHDVEPEVPSA